MGNDIDGILPVQPIAPTQRSDPDEPRSRDSDAEKPTDGPDFEAVLKTEMEPEDAQVQPEEPETPDGVKSGVTAAADALLADKFRPPTEKK